MNCYMTTDLASFEAQQDVHAAAVVQYNAALTAQDVHVAEINTKKQAEYQAAIAKGETPDEPEIFAPPSPIALPVEPAPPKVYVLEQATEDMTVSTAWGDVLCTAGHWTATDPDGAMHVVHEGDVGVLYSPVPA